MALWPVPEQLKGYLDSWAKYVAELEAQVAALERVNRDLEASYVNEVTELKQELSQLEAPLNREITQLRHYVQDAEQRCSALIAERQTVLERLALLLEISATTPGLTVLGLVNEATILVEETKKQFRESL